MTGIKTMRKASLVSETQRNNAVASGSVSRDLSKKPLPEVGDYLVRPGKGVFVVASRKYIQLHQSQFLDLRPVEVDTASMHINKIPVAVAQTLDLRPPASRAHLEVAMSALLPNGRVKDKPAVKRKRGSGVSDYHQRKLELQEAVRSSDLIDVGQAIRDAINRAPKGNVCQTDRELIGLGMKLMAKELCFATQLSLQDCEHYIKLLAEKGLKKGQDIWPEKAGKRTPSSMSEHEFFRYFGIAMDDAADPRSSLEPTTMKRHIALPNRFEHRYQKEEAPLVLEEKKRGRPSSKPAPMMMKQEIVKEPVKPAVIKPVVAKVEPKLVASEIEKPITAMKVEPKKVESKPVTEKAPKVIVEKVRKAVLSKPIAPPSQEFPTAYAQHQELLSFLGAESRFVTLSGPKRLAFNVGAKLVSEQVMSLEAFAAYSQTSLRDPRRSAQILDETSILLRNQAVQSLRSELIKHGYNKELELPLFNPI